LGTGAGVAGGAGVRAAAGEGADAAGAAGHTVAGVNVAAMVRSVCPVDHDGGPMGPGLLYGDGRAKGGVPENVHFFMSEEELHELIFNLHTEVTTYKGITVTRKLTPVDETELEARKRTILDVFLNPFKKKKKKEEESERKK